MEDVVRFVNGGGGVASTLPRLCARTRPGAVSRPRCRLRLFADGVPPAPGGWASALRVPRCRPRIVGRGCPACPLAQQCRTPRPTAAQDAHCLCWCATQTQRRGSRGPCSGRLATAHFCGGVKSTFACCCWAHLFALYCCIRRRWCQTAAGRVNIGLPFTPAVVPAPSGTRERHLLVKPAGRMDSLPAAFPSRLTASRRTLPFSCSVCVCVCVNAIRTIL